MRKLTNVPNTDGVSSNYPKGRMRNKTGSVLGTILGETLFGDIIQFFQKLVIDAGIIENDLPDNVTNNYQLKQAFEKAVGNVWTAVVDTDGSILSQKGTGVYGITKISTGLYRIDTSTDGSTFIVIEDLADYNIQVTPIAESGNNLFGNIQAVQQTAGQVRVAIATPSNVAADARFYITIKEM